jgi:hypothetical protein
VRLKAPDVRRASAVVPRDRRGLAALAAVVAIVLIVVIVSSGGQAEKPPATGAAALIPSDALAYIHLSTDESRPAVTSALALADRFPGYKPLRDGLMTKLGLTGPGIAVNFNTEIRPWLGKEVALAVFDTASSSAGTLVVVGVANKRAAEHFVASLPTDGSTSYDRATITGHPNAGDTAFSGHYLLIGHSASIRAALDVAAGRAPSLSRYPPYRQAAAPEPAARAVDAYMSATGVARLLNTRKGLLGVLGALLYQPTLEGLTVSLSPATSGLQVLVHSVLNPQLAHARPTSFTPSLPGSVPGGAALLLDDTGLNRLLPHLLATIGIGARIPSLLKRLGVALTAQGVDVDADIVSLFLRESAVIISTHGAAPVITVITRTPDPSLTRTVFADLEEPLERLFAPAGAAAGQSPLFNQVLAGGVAAHQLVLAPGLQFDYAVIGNRLVLSTSLAGIAGVARDTNSIVGSQAYRLTLGNRPARVTSLLFLDLSQLLRLDEQTGLISGARFLALKPDLERVHAIGLDSTSGEAESTAELFLQIP